MTFFQESHWQLPRTLSPAQVTYLRGVLVAHANDPATGRCAVCHAFACLQWRSAYDQLAMAGELMAQARAVT